MNNQHAPFDAKAAERKRLAEALRANLKRRKGAVAARDAPAEALKPSAMPPGKG